jgi:diadenylate cyclase
MHYVSETLSLISQLRLRDLIDILIVFLITYEVLRLIKGTRAVSMAAGVAVIALLYELSILLALDTLQFVLRNLLIYAPFAVIVLFQSEIRAALTHFGHMRNPLGFWFGGRNGSDQQAYDEIVLAATTLSSQKIGGLIVLEREVGLQNFIDTGIKLDARLTYDLLVTLFNTHAPLHDGAVIVRKDQIAAASCFLPLTLNPRLSKDLGTRHRAAIGITEDSDCVAVVISEETGVISFVQGGHISRSLDGPQLRARLQSSLSAERARPSSERPKPAKKPGKAIKTSEIESGVVAANQEDRKSTDLVKDTSGEYEKVLS